MNKKSKKGQLKIQEMSFMIVAIVLFFILAGLFVFSIIYSNLHKQATEIAEARTLSSITNLADSPEFNCVGGKSNCVDADKVVALIGKENYKDSFWQFSSLSVVTWSGLHKNESDWIKCTLSNYPDCDQFEIYDKGDKGIINERQVSNYVALCRKELENSYTYDKCEIAKLVAGTELK